MPGSDDTLPVEVPAFVGEADSQEDQKAPAVEQPDDETPGPLYPVTIWVQCKDKEEASLREAVVKVITLLNEKTTDDPYLEVNSFIGTTFEAQTKDGANSRRIFSSTRVAGRGTQLMPGSRVLHGDFMGLATPAPTPDAASTTTTTTTTTTAVTNLD